MTKITLAPLGGLGETGALNCFLYETAAVAFVVDCGVSFVDDRYPGVNLIIPDFDYLESIRHKLKAIVLTHGHEDHQGAMPYLLRRFPLPVYATAFTRGILRAKLTEFNLHRHEINELKFGEAITLGDVVIEPIFVNHSMMDVAALYFKVSDLSVLHCTDFKIDYAALDNGNSIDLKRFKAIGVSGLDILLLDSTNALVPGWTVSESVVRANLIEQVTRINGRVIVCLFSSNTYRLQSLIECARITGRRVAFTGRSTKEYSRVAIELGRLNLNGVEVCDVEELNHFADDQVMLLVTGSQAEPRSVLNRLSNNMFGPFKVKEGDTLIMSSRVIPGNEGRVYNMLNHMSLLGAEIIDHVSDAPIHASGHARQEELREIMRLTRPRCFVPIHGDYRHLKKHVQIAQSEGVKPENTLIMLDGDKAELNKTGLVKIDQTELRPIFVSEHSDFFISGEAVRRRQKLSWNGLVVVSCVYDHGVDRLRLPLMVDSEGLFGGECEVGLRRELAEFMAGRASDIPQGNIHQLRKFIKVEIRQYFKTKFDIRPEVIVLVNEI